jgi:hypothetical protein
MIVPCELVDLSRLMFVRIKLTTKLSELIAMNDGRCGFNGGIWR